MADETPICAADGCTEAFTPKRRTQKFCSPGCARQTANRRRTVTATGLDEALEVSQRRDVEQANRQELRRITALESRIRRYESVLESCLRTYEPTPLVIEPPRRKNDLPRHELVLCTGDWHTGLKTAVHETGAVYEQDVATTRDQVFRLWDRVVRLHEIQGSGIHFEKLHILGLGDLVHGDDMRPAQHREIEDVLTVQTVQAFDLFTWLIRQALTRFKRVEVDMVGGNHDRIGRARGNAGLGELGYADTVSWLIGEFTRRLFADEPRVKITNWHTFFGYKLIANRRVVFEHGSSIKWSVNSYGGIPWYGVSQLPRHYADMLGDSDLVVIGHGHRPAVLPNGRGWLIVNGALPATSPYEQSAFKAVHRPMQWLLSMHRKYGLTGYTPIYLDVPGTVLPGEVWTDPERYAELANSRLGP